MAPRIIGVFLAIWVFVVGPLSLGWHGYGFRAALAYSASLALLFASAGYRPAGKGVLAAVLIGAAVSAGTCLPIYLIGRWIAVGLQTT